MHLYSLIDRNFDDEIRNELGGGIGNLFFFGTIFPNIRLNEIEFKEICAQ